MLLDPETGCRIALAAIFAGILAIGLPSRIRAERAGGHVSIRNDPTWFWLGMAIIGPLMLATCVAFLVQPRWIDFAQVPANAIVRWLGVPVAVVGLFLFAWMFRHLGLNVTSTSMPRGSAELVTSGPYRFVRHPMYSAALILIAATALLTANLVVLIAGFSMFALLAARSRLEERRLIEKFGDAYRAYQARTGRFFPHLKVHAA
jgi:protein-S-isoprenylcysteine O-methyltransferase Ste14